MNCRISIHFYLTKYDFLNILLIMHSVQKHKSKNVNFQQEALTSVFLFTLINSVIQLFLE